MKTLKSIQTLIPIIIGLSLGACADGAGTQQTKPASPESNQRISSGALTKTALSADQQRYVDFLSQPNEVFVEMLTEPAVTIDGQVLHPKLQWEYEKDKKEPAKTKESRKATMLDQSAREKLRNIVDIYWDITSKVTPAMAAVHDINIPGAEGHSIPARIYVPDVTSGDEKLPVIVYYHGGGFLFGSVKALDGAVRLLATEAKVVAVSVDYRLSPEYPYPAPAMDAQDAFNWTVENIAEYGGDNTNIAVGGDSAGGFLAISTTIRQIENKAQVPTAQLLYYPFVDADYTKYPSYDLFKNGFGLDAGFMAAATELAMPAVDVKDPLVSPVLYPHMDKMPPTIAASAGFDPIRDHGRVFAEKLQAAGVIVKYHNYSSLTHGYLEASGTIDDAETAALETAHELGSMLRKNTP